ncbi:MAG: hypothetical protein FJY29_12935 [Betaproteobacteria bacterium]|nr:hypothetical protein [Betaproteobacteria bacterium]
MRHGTRALWHLNCGIFSSLAIIATSTSCSNEMSSSYSGSASPTPMGAKVLAAEFPACADPVRPLRVAFVIDNTGSNAATPGEVQKGPNFIGTDPVKSFVNAKFLLKDTDLAPLAPETEYTDRQIAVYKAILKLQRAAADARAKKPSFAGIDVGVAHFPYAPPGLPSVLKELTEEEKQRAAVSEEDLAKAVFHNGASKGLSDKMTDVSKIAFSDSWRNQIWKMLEFTHYSRGMTPYVTAFNAAKELLVAAKKDANDTRQGLMIFVTDGLPTDRKPSEIVAGRAAVGKDNRVALMSIYQAEANDDEQNKDSKASLKNAYTTLGWGTEEHASFDSYWGALRKVPQSGDVRDDYFQVKVTDFQKSLDQLLDRYLKCGTAKSSSNSESKSK